MKLNKFVKIISFTIIGISVLSLLNRNIFIDLKNGVDDFIYSSTSLSLKENEVLNHIDSIKNIRKGGTTTIDDINLSLADITFNFHDNFKIEPGKSYTFITSNPNLFGVLCTDNVSNYITSNDIKEYGDFKYVSFTCRENMFIDYYYFSAKFYVNNESEINEEYGIYYNYYLVDDYVDLKNVTIVTF